MRNTVLAAIAIISLTAAIGIALWVTGFPPERTTPDAAKGLAQQIVTFPLFWAGLSTLITVPVLYFKRRQLRADAGKAQRLPAIGAVTPALAILLCQVLSPLTAYDVLSDSASNLVFYYFLTGFFLVMGNYIVAAPFESRIGFRSKATLSDPVVWMRAHRYLGQGLVAIALLGVPLPFVLGADNAIWGLVGLVLINKAITWLYARKLALQQTLHRSAH